MPKGTEKCFHYFLRRIGDSIIYNLTIDSKASIFKRPYLSPTTYIDWARTRNMYVVIISLGVWMTTQEKTNKIHTHTFSKPLTPVSSPNFWKFQQFYKNNVKAKIRFGKKPKLSVTFESQHLLWTVECRGQHFGSYPTNTFK